MWYPRISTLEEDVIDFDNFGSCSKKLESWTSSKMAHQLGLVLEDVPLQAKTMEY